MLISRALAAANSLSTRNGVLTSLAVFDAGLEGLKLPLMRPVSPEGPLGEGPSSSTSESMRRESIAFLIQRYFEWVGTVEEEGM